MLTGIAKVRPTLAEFAKTLFGLAVIGGIVWVTVSLKKEEPHRGRRIDSTNAFHEFLECHKQVGSLYSDYLTTPSASADEKRQLLDRCRALTSELDPKVYEECDKRLAGAIAGYKTARTQQLVQALSLLPSAPDEKSADKAQDRVDSLRRRVYNEMKRVKRDLGIRKVD